MRVLVTGAAGFIGYHLAGRLLSDGHTVVGIDNLDGYYDVGLKRARLAELSRAHAAGGLWTFSEADVCDREKLSALFAERRFDCVVHLAAQAGVRYSIENPFAYQRSNLEGFLSVLESCRHASPMPRLIYASSSSVYGGNTVLPFSEDQAVDHPISLYAATKRADELMAHVYTHLYGLQTVGLRFFTVYGPWYRPDMAMYLFADAMTQGRPIRVFNRGDMRRDFTYVDDVVDGVARCVTAEGFDPYELFNVGNNRPERLLDLIDLLATALDVKPRLELLPMQDGDVPATWANIDRLHAKTGYSPKTPLRVGVPNFAAWYRNYTGR
jgi:UDP-glucuronate 4-epimerase